MIEGEHFKHTGSHAGMEAMKEATLRSYLELSVQDISSQLDEMNARPLLPAGQRQGVFNGVETLLCYGLFYLLDPHRYGGGNIDKVPAIVNTLATLFHRSPGSITNKMLNLDGSRAHGAHVEPLLFATLASDPSRYLALYRRILATARDLGLDEQMLPDFLGELITMTGEGDLLGQDDVPASTMGLLADAKEQLRHFDSTLRLGEHLTEKLVERKIRLAQHRFALDVLRNCGRTCVFCGFAPRSLPGRSGLLRASHIKPWAVSTAQERVDVRNGVAACPIHDSAFDQGYLSITDEYRILRARLLEESIARDQGAAHYFGAILRETLILPEQARRPALPYLAYHYKHIFKGA